MATIAPGRLHDVSNAADFVALTETNFEILTAEVFKQEATYVSGVPTTTVGPPTTGSHVLNEIWKDALGGVFKCTLGGTPGTWKQLLPAAVTADPSSGTIPNGYQIRNVTENGVEKWHAGSYLWIRTHGHANAVVGSADLPWGAFAPGAAWAVIDLISATLAFTLQAGIYFLLAVLRVEPNGTDTLYLRLQDTTVGADVILESHYVVSDLRSITLSAVVTLAAPATVEVQAKQLDDCAILANGTAYVAIRLA